MGRDRTITHDIKAFRDIQEVVSQDIGLNWIIKELMDNVVGARRSERWGASNRALELLLKLLQVRDQLHIHSDPEIAIKVLKSILDELENDVG